MISEGFDLMHYHTYSTYSDRQTDLSKHCRPRSDAAERGVWSAPTQFATHSAILHTLTCSKNGLVEETFKVKSKSVKIRVITYSRFIKLSKFSHENGILSQRRVRPTLFPNPPHPNPLWIRPCALIWSYWCCSLVSFITIVMGLDWFICIKIIYYWNE